MSKDPPLELRPLTVKDEAAFLHALSEGAEPNFAHYYRPGMSFAQYLATLKEHEKGMNLPADHVPSTCYFGFVGKKIVGRLSLRYEMNEFLRNVGGHIGYVVLPPYRRAGHATEMLRQSLVFAGRLKMGRVLLTCDEGNLASRKTIEKCGGVFENKYHGPEVISPKLRYWIDL